MINVVNVTYDRLDELLQLARITFKKAFEHQNSPENFKLYMRQAFNRPLIEEQFNDPNIRFYFITKNEQVVGYLKINEKKAQTEQFDSESMELERFYILNEFQGLQIGQSVLQKVLKIAEEKGVAFLWLGVWDKNSRAIRFYERHGFKKFGSHPYYLGKDKQTDYLMKIDLTPPFL